MAAGDPVHLVAELHNSTSTAGSQQTDDSRSTYR